MKRWALIFGIIVVFSLIIFFLSTPSKQTPSPQPLPTVEKTKENPLGLQVGNYPWSIETDTLKDRLASLNLPALTSEGSVIHTHQHLDIFIEGKNIPIPSDIGVDEKDGFISAVHTHDGTGIIHVESPTVATFTLGQFFNIWGVRFTNQCLGGYCGGADKKLNVYINGQMQKGNYQDITLEAHQEIVITYGTDAQIPQPIPAIFNFPAED